MAWPRPRAAGVASLVLVALAVTAGVAWRGGGDAAEAGDVEGVPGGGQSVPAFILMDDEFLGEQWGLFNWEQRLGGVLGGTADADIRAPEAWAITRGSRDVIVAVIDTGIDFEHPDLAANLWTNPGEMGDGRESNGIDDDGNGLVDDWRGWDFFADDNDPTDELSSVLGGPSIAHGTAVASVVGAVGGNGIGISGVAPEVSLMALRVAGAGSVADGATADAIDYAASMGARVVNISIVSGIPGWPNQPVDEAIARHPDVLFVVSAGNQGSSVDILDLEPCAQSHDNIICVGASDSDDALARWVEGRGGSNWGSTTVDLLAPGLAIAVAAPSLETIFEDTFEGPLDPSRWRSGSGGTRTSRAGASVGGAWGVEDGRLVDSPGGTHSADEETWVELLTPIDLTDRQGCWLIATEVTAATGGATTMFTETSRDGSRWTIRAGRSGFTLSDTLGEEVHHEMPLTIEQDAPFVFRFRLRPLVSAGLEPLDGVGMGSVRVDCLARPGEATDGHGLYGYAQGTSFAAPHVAGAAALVLAAYPDLSALEVKQALLEGNHPLPDLADRTVSGGRLDAEGALNAAAALAGEAPPAGTTGRLDGGAVEAVSPGGLPAGALMDLVWGLAGQVPDGRVAGGSVGGGGAAGASLRGPAGPRGPETPPALAAPSGNPLVDAIMGAAEQVGGFFVGAAEQIGDEVTGILDLAGSVWRSVNFVDGEGFREQWEANGAFWDQITSQGIHETAGQMLEAMWEPIADDIDGGRYGEAAGRFAVLVASFLVGAKGADKAGKLAKAGKGAKTAQRSRTTGLADDVAPSKPLEPARAPKPVGTPQTVGKPEAVGTSANGRSPDPNFTRPYSFGWDPRHIDMVERGWTPDEIQRLIDSPAYQGDATDFRRKRVADEYNSAYTKDRVRKNDNEARAYVAEDGNFVIVNEHNDIVMISDRTDPNWKPPEVVRQLMDQPRPN